MADRQFSLPRRSRLPWWVWIIALAVHMAIMVIVIGRRHAASTALFDTRDLAISDSNRAVSLPYPRSVAPAVPKMPSDARVIAPQAAVITPPTDLARAIALVPVDTPPTGAVAIRPRYGNGRLWVAPLAASPRDIARTLTGKTNAQLNDSAVTAMVQAYLDAMAREQAQNPNALPSWTTKIGGKTVGLDSKWIYLGPLKIPTMLLALLPIHVQANPTQAEWNAKLQAMRSDLLEAARRAETYDEFKKAVKDLRDQTEQAREFKKNQRTPPDTSHHG